ncbi:MAG: hypothetical protein UW63_C0043G0020 [Candidatus Uhrbacteria bacterium GW2011_GWF2_44_350]|uniref:Uncharacterized protein n=1 Tax=Candidatus Uhrbacteria bacterium GW2011_GWF2_44_350 TaxID=1619000 RepID=A0A0G1JEY9_9BACT|nr:MAG: hypothetical protein UW63_C0043G0020 [Candidatus Uhrbacteria bacterium GW2011_GWF2_44_350]HBR80641.1 hypothetical protein [Candidatus Uhrbacteria bacterium]HCU32195.1 hypothetical protein [Candidatus Uhrbacteria bacterium]
MFRRICFATIIIVVCLLGLSSRPVLAYFIGYPYDLMTEQHARLCLASPFNATTVDELRNCAGALSAMSLRFENQAQTLATEQAATAAKVDAYKLGD